MGGLSAAASLVKAGLRVLVLEKALHPGGTAYVYTRKGFTFPMGPLGFSTPKLVRESLAALGQDNSLHFRRVRYQIRAFDIKLPLSLTFSRIKEEMIARFPADLEGINRFFQDVKAILDAMRHPDLAKNRRLLEAAAKTSARGYLRELIADWRLRRFLGSLGTQEAYAGLPLLAATWNLMCKEGIWYPQGGMRSFCIRLAQAATRGRAKLGGFGEMRLGVDVKEIRVRHGRALGVTLVDGSHIDAAGVISNADYKTTFMRLLKSESIPERWCRAVSRARQTGSILQVCLGVDAKRADLSAFSEASRLIFRQDETGSRPDPSELDWSAPEVDPETLAAQELEVSLWSREDPSLAPKGGAVLVIRVEANHGHFAKYQPALGQRAPTYGGYKRRLGEALVRKTAGLIPGLEQAVLVMDVATPLTFEERGGRSQGAVAGWSWDFEDNSDYHPLELVKTPILGLYMAGYQAYSTLSMGGMPTAMASGQRAAEALLQGAGPIEDIRIPGVTAS